MSQPSQVRTYAKKHGCSIDIVVVKSKKSQEVKMILFILLYLKSI